MFTTSTSAFVFPYTITGTSTNFVASGGIIIHDTLAPKRKTPPLISRDTLCTQGGTFTIRRRYADQPNDLQPGRQIISYGGKQFMFRNKLFDHELYKWATRNGITSCAQLAGVEVDINAVDITRVRYTFHKPPPQAKKLKVQPADREDEDRILLEA